MLVFILYVLISFFISQFFFGEYGFKVIKEEESIIIEKQSIYKHMNKITQILKNSKDINSDSALKDFVQENNINLNEIHNIEDFVADLLILFKIEIQLANNQYYMIETLLSNLEIQPNFHLDSNIMTIYILNKDILKQILKKANKLNLKWKINRM